MRWMKCVDITDEHNIDIWGADQFFRDKSCLWHDSASDFLLAMIYSRRRNVANVCDLIVFGKVVQHSNVGNLRDNVIGANCRGYTVVCIPVRSLLVQEYRL